MLTASGRVMGLDSILYKKLGDRALSKKVPILNMIKLW